MRVQCSTLLKIWFKIRGLIDSSRRGSAEGVVVVIQPEKGMMSRHPAHSMYLRLTHKLWASYGHALGLSDWRLVSGYDCVGTLE